MKQRFVIALASTVVTAGLAIGALELYTRFTKPDYSPETLRQQSLEYEATVLARHAFPRAIQRKDWGFGSATINSRGYRGRDFAVPKPSGVVRVVVLGGSSAFDTSARDGHDWPHLVEQRLRAHGLASVEVINAGVPGHASWDAITRLFSEIWMFDPDYVLEYGAWNDIKYFRWLSPDVSLLRGVRPAKTLPDSDLVANPLIYYSGPIDRWLSHSQVYVRLRQGAWQRRIGGALGFEGVVQARSNEQSGPGHPSYPDTFGPWGIRQYELNLRLLAAASRQIGAEAIFVTEGRLATAASPESDRVKIGANYNYAHLSHEGILKAFAEADRALRAAAIAEHVTVIDASAQISGRTEFFGDLIHTSAAGSEALATIVGDALGEIIRRRQPKPQDHK